MKLISILFISLAVLFACGKKTDPIPKSTLADLTPPAAVFYSVTDEGVKIQNEENDNLFIEKGIPEGEECTFYNTLTLIGPKSVYVDKEVEEDQKYFYRVKRQSVKYGLLSAPYIFALTYEKPVKIINAQYLKTPTGYNINIEPSGIFMRFDVYSGGKNIARTGTNFTDVPFTDVADNRLTLILSDYYGNKGIPYVLEITPEKKLTPPSAVSAVAVLDYAKEKRIAWADAENAKSYKVQICAYGRCEDFVTIGTSVVYNVKSKCIDIKVTAVNDDGESKPSKTRYCKPEEE